MLSFFSLRFTVGKETHVNNLLKNVFAVTYGTFSFNPLQKTQSVCWNLCCTKYSYTPIFFSF